MDERVDSSLHLLKKQKLVEIELKLKTIKQLFNSFDPSPFIEKDLDNDAFEFIFSYFQEIDLKTKTKIVIHLPTGQKHKTPENKVRIAISNFFTYQERLEQIKIKQKLSEGRKSLIIGTIALVSCLLLKTAILTMNIQNEFVATLASEGLTIGGWVAMWKPISNILYDWWPLQKEKEIYGKISNSEIEFVYY